MAGEGLAATVWNDRGAMFDPEGNGENGDVMEVRLLRSGIPVPFILTVTVVPGHRSQKEGAMANVAIATQKTAWD
jgi:hypothetical protein